MQHLVALGRQLRGRTLDGGRVGDFEFDTGLGYGPIRRPGRGPEAGLGGLDRGQTPKCLAPPICSLKK